jgi:uncharacterized damage-inducible protein DinB
MLESQFDNNRWANDRVLKEAARAGKEDWTRPAAAGERSLGQILAHMASVEMVWRLLAQTGQIKPGQLPADDEIVDAKAISQFLQEEQRSMEGLLAEMAENDLAEAVAITRWDGIKVVMTRWQMLVHLLLHSMQHRSEAAVLLTTYGYSPGDIDFLFFALAQ